MIHNNKTLFLIQRVESTALPGRGVNATVKAPGVANENRVTIANNLASHLQKTTLFFY
jgi:hypothetical protein